jgi:glycosyltransferase involved in cell wall biosynthesis
MKIAIVHDFLNQYGGAERVVGYLSEIFPEAPIYTSIYFSGSTYSFFKDKKIITSFMQKIPGINRNFRKFFFLYPLAFKRFNLKGYDIVITSFSSYSNNINKAKAINICYCYSPPRFLWETDKYFKGERLLYKKFLFLRPFIYFLKKQDLKNSRNVDHFLTLSEFIKKRIKRIYGSDSIVIYPPIEFDKYLFSDKKEDYYLLVSRLRGYKKVDLAIEAFNKLNRRLLIVGKGEDLDYLKSISNKNIEFLGRIDELELFKLYSCARALIFPGEEDFGLTPLEAQASGTPVIAFGSGGALETIIDGETGLFFNEQNSDSLIEAVERFEKHSIDYQKCRKNAEHFDTKYFKQKILDFVNNTYAANLSYGERLLNG